MFIHIGHTYIYIMYSTYNGLRQETEHIGLGSEKKEKSDTECQIFPVPVVMLM